MDGHLVVDRGSIHDLIQVFYANKRHFDLTPSQIFWRGLSRKDPPVPAEQCGVAFARANVKAHYDIGEDLYRLFLDRDMQYSCAYFPEWHRNHRGGTDAEEASPIAAKLCLKDGHRLLDIGCGWGGLGTVPRPCRRYRGGRRHPVGTATGGRPTPGGDPGASATGSGLN
jgi:cyclopropane-fatty-acyl-phospholipid synthase